MSGEQARFLVNNGMTRKSRARAQINLRDQVRNSVLFPKYADMKKTSGTEKELLPIPCSQGYKHRGPKSRQQGLPDVVRIWPTPTARDYKDGSKSACAHVPVNGLLGRAVHVDNPTDGQLNAAWTEQLMGYPKDWTDAEKECSFENRYPEAWLSGAWEDGIPRVITGQKHRSRRIKALGNSIVPQIPYLLFLSPVFDRWR
jgi:hypothetical protein